MQVGADKHTLQRLGFYEVLYAVCERKVGTVLPADNQVCSTARKKLGAPA